MHRTNIAYEINKDGHLSETTLAIAHKYNFFHGGSRDTPYIHFHANTGQLVVHGKSMPEDPRSIYDVLIRKLDGFIESTQIAISVSIKMEYFNTSSSKCIWEVLRALKNSDSVDTPLRIQWHYEEEDEDMLEAGRDYSELLNIEFDYYNYESKN